MVLPYDNIIFGSTNLRKGNNITSNHVHNQPKISENINQELELKLKHDKALNCLSRFLVILINSLNLIS